MAPTSMPELPDVTVYVERMNALLVDQVLRAVRLRSPFLLRSVDPPLGDAHGATVRSVRRMGKRIIVSLDGDLHLVVHLMVAGRLRWKAPGAKIPASNGLAGFDFDHGTLMFTEAAKKKRASLHVVASEEALAQFDRGGLEIMDASPESFRAALTRENHTLKRALTDPRILSGIGNAYSDEILHAARLSPFKQTRSMDDAEFDGLLNAMQDVLQRWTSELREEVGEGFPDKVTAFRKGMAVHGRYGEPCPECGAPVQRIVYASNESNYCARCQTGGKILADRALSRLLKKSWPRTLEEMEGA